LVEVAHLQVAEPLMAQATQVVAAQVVQQMARMETPLLRAMAQQAPQPLLPESFTAQVARAEISQRQHLPPEDRAPQTVELALSDLRLQRLTEVAAEQVAEMEVSQRMQKVRLAR
jgi:hypothetical protein